MSDTDDQKQEEKLYAGKFKTVEDLETGYKNAATVFDENSTLKKKVEELSHVPEVYANPSDVELDAQRLSDLQTRAKESGLTQAQYDKYVRNEKARSDRVKQNFEAARKEVGEETMNILNDYVAKHYPKELQQNMINTFISNKEARQAALSHRQQLLNNRVPGMDRTAPISYNITDEDVRKAYDRKEKSRSKKDIDSYMSLINAKAAQNAQAN